MKLIAVTTYYNPCKYISRSKNYEVFRKNLQVPLLTIELSFDGIFELNESDSDILLQVKGDSVLWQKERLLNIAVSHIPKDFEYVAWLDCDIIIASDEWVNNAIFQLQNFKMIQLFSELVDLPKGILSITESISSHSPSGISISSLWAKNEYSIEDFRPPTTKRLRRAAFGLAWAARLSLIKKHSFYDAMIIGSGDRAVACAAMGRFEDAVHVGKMNSDRENHYLKWAVPFFEEIGGNVGYLDNRLYHLWHGSLQNRKYVERHKEFSQFSFDPVTDIFIDINGCWKWSDGNSCLKNFVLNYFVNRNEDDL